MALYLYCYLTANGQLFILIILPLRIILLKQLF